MSKVKVQFFLSLIFLTFISLWGMRALFHPGFYTSHDGWHQVARLYHFDQIIKAGQFPPRYSFNLLFGYGYPLFTFSYHMPWLIAELLVLSRVSIFNAIKIVFILGFVVSGLTMFLWQRELWGDVGGVLASFVYLWTPYHFSTILVRAALGEVFSFIFMPLFFYGLHRLQQKFDSSALVVGSLGLAGLILSHTMILFLLVMPTFFYFLYLLWDSRRKLSFLKRSLLLLFLGICLSAYYVIPAAVYQSFTRFKEVQKMAFQTQFVSLRDLFYSPWGYAASYTGVGQMSLQVGITQWLIAVSALLVVLVYILRKRFSSKIKLGAIFLLTFIFCVYLISTHAKPVWEIFKSTFPIDFPWRFLSITTLLSAALAGFLLYALPKQMQPLCIIAVFIIAFYTNRNYQQVNQYTDIPLWLYVASEKTTNTFDEYLPTWANMYEVTKENRQPLVIKKNVLIKNYIQVANFIKFNYESTQITPIRINSIYFPGMSLSINHKASPFTYKENGYINFKAPEGKNEVELKVSETSLEKASDSLTIIGVLLSCYFLLKPKKQPSFT